MKTFKVNRNININGTYFQDYLPGQISRSDLETAFGPPLESRDSKTTLEWQFSDPAGCPFTIYNYKDESRDSDNDKPYDWHIGASSGVFLKDFIEWVTDEILDANDAK